MTSFYGQLRDSYAELPGKQKSAVGRAASIRRLQRLLYPHLPAARQCALDLGAGQGELVEALHRLGYASVEGIELSPSQVRLAELHGQAVREGDAGQALAEQPDASLDLICCFDVFEHLSHDTCARWFSEIQRVLAPGGRLIGHVLNGLSPFVGSVYWGDLTHVWCPVPESIQVFCRTSGLNWLGAYENIGVSTGIKGRFRSILWRGVRFALAFASTVEPGRASLDFPWSRTFLFVLAKN